MQLINSLNINQLKLLIQTDKIKVISFDIFDTLLVRPTVNPKDIFYLLKAEANKLLPSKFDDFYLVRLTAEKEARNELAKENPNYGEITLTQIYNHIAKSNNLNESEKSKLMQAEIDLETRVLYIRKVGKTIYDFATASGKKVILVSDMYLEKEVVENILFEKGISGYKNLYISSDIKARKDTGELYKYVLECEKILPEEMLHIGDNSESDVDFAEKEGIKTFQIPKGTDIVFSENSVHKKIWGNFEKLNPSERILLGICTNKLAEKYIEDGHSTDTFNDLFTLGYYGIGPVIFAIADKIAKDENIQKNYSCIHFASRDGYLPKKVYDILYSSDKKYLPTKYIYGGRQAYHIADYSGDVFKYLSSKNSHDDNYSIINLFDALVKKDFLLNKYPNEWFENSSLNADASAGFTKVRQIIEEHHNEIKNILDKKYEFAKKYYKTEIMFNPENRAIIFDVGYSGSVSKDIGHLSQGKIDKVYLWQSKKNETVDSENGTVTNTLIGYHSDLLKKPPLDLIIEELFSPLESACVGFKEDVNQMIIPRFNENELFTDRMKDDLLNVHEGILAFVEDLISILGVYKDNLQMLSLDHLLRPLEVTFSNPQDNSIRLLDNIIFPDAYSRSNQISLAGKIEQFRPKHIQKSNPLYTDLDNSKNDELSINENNFNETNVLFHQSLRVNQYALENNVNEVQTMFTKVINPMEINDLIKLSEDCIEKNEIAEAKKILTKILTELDPDSVDAANNYAVAELLDGNIDSAKSIISQVLTKDPQNEIALGNLEYIFQTEIAEANENIQANEQAKTQSSQIHSSSSEELIKKYNLNSNYQSAIGGGDFVKVGEDLLQQMIKACNLSPDEKVLDVGSGYGRLALPLSKYLNENGEYRGMEIVKNEVDWCMDVITSQRNNFRFIHADVYNFHYNRGGSTRACFYKFPFESNYFDFVLLTSVFTHMLSFELDNYLSEIARVLKPGGRSFITYFLMNEESKRLMEEKQSAMYFPTKIGEFWLKDVNDPEAAVCFDESFILDLYKRHGLKVETPLKYGQWSGRKSFFDYQDVIIAKK